MLSFLTFWPSYQPLPHQRSPTDQCEKWTNLTILNKNRWTKLNFLTDLCEKWEVTNSYFACDIERVKKLLYIIFTYCLTMKIYLNFQIKNLWKFFTCSLQVKQNNCFFKFLTFANRILSKNGFLSEILVVYKSDNFYHFIYY